MVGHTRSHLAIPTTHLLYRLHTRHTDYTLAILTTFSPYQLHTRHTDYTLTIPWTTHSPYRLDAHHHKRGAALFLEEKGKIAARVKAGGMACHLGTSKWLVKPWVACHPGPGMAW